jgi:purine-binding chemotaxis protein CheW
MADTTNLAVCFSVGDSLCAFDAAPIQEVVRAGSITPVHRAPASVLGIVNLRGRIVTVVDLRRRLELGAGEQGDDARILILDCDGEPVGFLVEREEGAVEYDPGALRNAPRNLESRLTSMVIGVIPSGDRLVALLDARAVAEPGA